MSNQVPSDGTSPQSIAFWHAVTRFANDNGSKDAKDELLQTVRDLAGLPASADVYLAKLTGSGYNNQVWQGKSISQDNEISVFIDQTSNQSGVYEAARGRLNPRADNGFECIVVAQPDATGGWNVHSVVEFDHSQIGANLEKKLGRGLNIVRFADPAVTAAPLPASAASVDPMMTLPSPEADGDLTAYEVLEHLQEAKNVVIEGPPGTGKTRLARQVAALLGEGDAEAYRLEALLDGSSIDDRTAQLRAAPIVWEIIQLHPGFGYDEFVRGLRTNPDAKGFDLQTVDGILPQIAHVASIRQGKPTLLIIDEINRGNLSAILGETIFAIDPAHRDREVKLQYDAPPGGKDTLSVPENLFLLATMNSADRSIAMLDFAVRRRFRFLRLESSAEALSDYYAANPHRAQRATVLFESFKNAIADRDLRPGHSYFIVPDHAALDDDQWAQRMSARIIHDIKPLFDEYSEEGLSITPPKLTLENETIDLLAPSTELFRTELLAWLKPFPDTP